MVSGELEQVGALEVLAAGEALVPSDLAAERIAPNVVKQGVGYLKSMGYQLLSDWGDDPTVIDHAG